MKSSASKNKKDRTKTVSAGRFMTVMEFLLQMNFYYCLVLLGYYILYRLGKGPFEPAGCLGMMGCFLPVYVISRKVRALWKILALDFLVLLLAGSLFPAENGRWWLVVSLLIFAVLDLLTKGNRQSGEQEIVWAAENSALWGVGIWILMAAAVAAEAAVRGGETNQSCVKLMLAVFCLFLAEYFLQRYFYLIYDYFRKIREMDRMDRGHSARLVSFGAVCGVTVAGMVFALSGLLSRFVGWIFQLAGSLWGTIWSNVAGDSSLPDATPLPEPYRESIKGNGRELLEHAKRSPMIAHMANLLVGLLVLVIIALVLYYIYRILRTTKYFQSDQEEVITIVDRAGPEVQKPAGVMERFRYGNTAAHQIRRCFSRLVERRNQERPIPDLKKLTAGEIAKKLPRAAGEKDRIKELETLYENARYEEKTVSKEQAARAKEICRHLS